MEIKQGFYWINLIIYHKITNESIVYTAVPTVGFFEGETLMWCITGSDNVFKTYEKGCKMEHLETRIIPLKQIENFKED